jgi:hypothetical protein
MVDYSIGRKFAITESGWMGLVPKKTEKGDVVTLLGRERWCFVLRPDGGKGEKDRETERDEESEKRPEEDDEDSGECFELVGEAYFHGLVANRDEDMADDGNKKRSEGDKEGKLGGNKNERSNYDKYNN